MVSLFVCVSAMTKTLAGFREVEELVIKLGFRI
jgi:hypothetical protein